MKYASPALIALLNGDGFVYADLYSFTLNGGGVVRLSGGDRLINANVYIDLSVSSGAGLTTDSGEPVVAFTYDGGSYVLGAPISDGGVKARVGLAVDPVEITILGDENTTFAGEPLLPFIRANGLDGCAIRIDRAFAPDWATMASSGPTGVVNRFSGRYSALKSLSRTGAVIEAAPWTELLTAQMPTNLYQASCNHVLFDAGCGLSPAGFSVAGAVLSGSSPTQILTALAAPTGYYALGKLVFQTGVNAGVARTVKFQDALGTLTLIAPLGAAPAAGDQFTLYAGCDLSQATCQNKFGNLANFRGFPYVPAPEAAL